MGSHYKSIIRKCATILISTILLPLGIALNIYADTADILTCFQTGVANIIGTDVGTIMTIFNGIVFFIFIFVNISYIQFGTFLLTISLGTMVNFYSDIFNQYLPQNLPLWLSIIVVVIGTTIISIAISIYLPINLGIQPIDMLVLSLAKLYKKTYGMGLNFFYIIVFIATLLVNGKFGVGTLINMILTGRLIDYFMPRLKPTVFKIAGMSAKTES